MTDTINSQIRALNSVGQSVWYDNLSRDLLRSGELRELVNAGVSGLTSNPTIFKKAIADTADYDGDIARLSAGGAEPEAVLEDLTIGDVAAAADLLSETWKRSAGADGFASIEVSPLLARDAASTLQAAKRIWTKLGRPNVMVKIPGTSECLPAIKAAVEEGINVNITLLFSVQQYRKVAEAYLQGLESRLARGEDLSRVSSVASFFVSRVDAICEKSFDALLKAERVNERDRRLFLGKAGIANARLAYAAFKETVLSRRFANLQAAGARKQRPLWASTGTKNPALGPLIYVEGLAGRDTVNTMPPATLDALLKRATVKDALGDDSGDTEQVLSRMREMGIDFEQLMETLLIEGLDLFANSYRDLLSAVRARQSLTARSQHG